MSPVTELLQESISQSVQGEEPIPEIDNLFTTAYFLHALGFGAIIEVFLDKMSLSESGEEWSAEEGEP